jgi:hypothetical protein
MTGSERDRIPEAPSWQCAIPSGGWCGGGVPGGAVCNPE